VRVLRASVWVMANMPPMTTVTRESDLQLSIEETVKALIQGPEPLTVELRENPALVTHEVFEMEDGELEPAIPEAMRRFQERHEEEANMATLYFWNGDALRMTQGEGHLINPRPAPLSADDIEATLKQLASHPNYQHQRVVTTSREGIEVEMKDGEVTRRRRAPSPLL
jgi:spore germination protein GerM